MEVHFSQRLILGEWSWSLHRATEKVATVPVYKSQNGEKVYKNPLSVSVHSTSECLKKRARRQKGDSLFCSEGPLIEGSTSGVSPHLKQRSSFGRIL